VDISWLHWHSESHKLINTQLMKLGCFKCNTMLTNSNNSSLDIKLFSDTVIMTVLNTQCGRQLIKY